MSDPIELTDDEYNAFTLAMAEQRCHHPRGQSECPPPPERAILTDLIVELRGISYETDNPWTVAYTAVDRAEARLREVTDV